MDFIVSHVLSQFQLPLRSPILIFSLILFVILLAPLVLERLRAPGVIGLILSGIIIGPHGLNILGSSLFVDVFSTIGLMYIMFLAGLDLNLVEFKANQHKSLVFGLLTFCIPLAIGLPVCYYLLGMDIYASLLVSSIFATHTLVTYPIAGQYGITKDTSVAITVGGTILTDTAVLLVLAMILGAHNGGLTQEFWVRIIISLVLFSAFMFIVVPRVGAWFFKTMAEQKHSHYIFVLAVVFLSAFLADAAGLEGIIGAFAAGLALNKLIPHSSALMNRISFIGNSLFIPFFLISVGMLVDLRVVFSGPLPLLIAGALTIVALIGKYVAAHATQKAFGLSYNQGQLIFGLSSAHAAATLAVVLVGYRQGIVGDQILNAIVVIILVSCLVASFVTSRVARRMAAEAGDATETEVTTLASNEQILVPLSTPSKIEGLLHFAVLIKDKAAIKPIALLNVVPNNEEAEKQIATVRKAMEGSLGEATAAEANVNVMATIDQSVAHGISRAAREVGAKLVVLGWPQSEEALNALVTDNARGLLQQTQKSVFICSFPRGLVQHGTICLVVPAYAELETGFPVWLSKVIKLSAELSAPIRVHGVQRTWDAMQEFAASNKMHLQAEFTPFDAWEDFFIVSRELTDADLVVIISARRSAYSHNAWQERLPAKLNKHFAHLNKILVYPQ